MMKVTRTWIGAVALAVGLGTAGTAMADNDVNNNLRAAQTVTATTERATVFTGPVQRTNKGEMRQLISTGHDLSGADGPGAILYAPSESDNPQLRADISAITGGPVDYFDPRVATPTVAQLSAYDCVYVWANFAFLDNVAYGDNLAAYVDGGGTVVLGAFCTYTSGNFLSGAIMSPAYCPVVSPTGSNHFSDSSYVGDGVSCIYDGVASYNAFYRDILVGQGSGVLDGSFADGEICHAYRPDGRVVYSNGNEGIGSVGGDYARLIANSCSCLGGTGSRIDCACDGRFDVGDRVRATVNNPSGLADVLMNDQGTVICGSTGSPPLLVMWDNSTSGHNGNGFCDCPDEPIVTPSTTSWYVQCEEIDIHCPADINSNGEIEFGDILQILQNWGLCTL